MQCPFCSLLCDDDGYQQVRCSVRFNALVALEKIQKNRLLPNTEAIEERIELASRMLQAADHVLITGRITSVQTARAAIRLATRLNAAIDCAEEGHAFKNIFPIQRNGVHSVSIGEARDHADLLIVVGDDSILSGCPRIPEALHPGYLPDKTSKTALLLGEFSEATQQLWRQAGFDTWFIPCKLENIPAALMQWSAHADQVEQAPPLRPNDVGFRQIARPAETLGEFRYIKSMPFPISPEELSAPQPDVMHRLANARYTAVLWVASSLRFQEADLWIERLMQWIAGQNETKRCAGLLWSSLEGSFQQTCTWLTGFPGRIQFRGETPHYDPNLNSYTKWIESVSTHSGTSAIVLIDETVAQEPFLTIDRGMVPAIEFLEITATSSSYPCAIAGAEVPADMFRADQVVVARVAPYAVGPNWSEVGRLEVSSAADWLERLCR